ncbi:hypothetical protein [Elizabethkingia miricola]|uniref:hypothetical protein n=1 Tax=Elizabethkingia miricola TaxID=172045 RepID=UPI00099A09E6|nr:hypothetical protein [Elizabethkingia miricola]OPC34588.1 hypothetical protein BAX99_06895 [Elizabethkingia miricola]
MNPRELRIGNLLQDCVSKVPYEVTHNTFSSLVAYIEEEKEYPLEPIPLTEEWLWKFGFEDRLKNINDLEFSISIENKALFIFQYNEPKGLYFDIEFVHQLQNLYFALTAEELTIK